MFKRLGTASIGVLIAIVGGIVVVVASPFLTPLGEQIRRSFMEAQSEAPPTRAASDFVVIVANFGGDDDNNTQADRISVILNEQLAELEIIHVDRVSRTFVDGARPSQDRDQLRSNADRWTREYNADAIIWGLVRPLNNELELHIYVAPSSGPVEITTSSSGARYALNDLAIGKDFAEHLLPLLAVGAALDYGDTQRITPSALAGFIARIGPLADAPPPWLTGSSRTLVSIAYGEGLAVQGRMLRDAARIHLAISELQEAAALIGTNATLRAIVFRSIAFSYERLDELEAGTNYHEEIVAALREGLSSDVQATAPEVRADLHAKLAQTLSSYGRWQRESEPLRQAVNEMDLALTYWTRERDIVRWAMLKDDQASILNRLSELSDDPNGLTQATEGHRDAVEAFFEANRFDRVAIAQNNLGRALYLLALQSHDRAHLQEALMNYDRAAEYFRSQGQLLDMATAQHNSADALMELSRGEETTWNLERAIRINLEVLELRSQASTEREVALTHSRLGAGLEMLAERTGRIEQYREAHSHQRAAHQLYVANGLATLAADTERQIDRLEEKIATR